MTKPTPKTYIIYSPDTDETCVWLDPDANTALSFDNPEDAVQYAKDHNLSGVVVTTVARITPETRYKVERWK